MIDTSSVADSLRTLAEQVKQSDPRGSDRLNFLGDAVQTGANADAWAYSDIHAMIGPDSIVDRYRSSASSGLDRGIAILETVRNTLIFAPIIVTWYGISQATDQYNAFVDAATKANRPDLYSQPFLYLWQQRFGGRLPDFLTLSHVAFTDVIILAIVLIFTLSVYILSNVNKAHKEADAQRLRSNLLHAITGATLSLHARPKLTTGDNMDVVARKLSETLDNAARSTASRLDYMAQQTTARLDKMAQDVTTHWQKAAQDTTGRFETMARELTLQFVNTTQQTRTQLESIAQEMNRQVQTGNDYLLKMGSLTSGVIQTSTEIQTAANTLRTSNTNLTTSVNNLIKPVEALAQQQTTLLNSVQNAAGMLQGTAAGMNAMATEQKKMADELADIMADLGIAIKQFDKSSKEQNGVAIQLGSFLQTLEKEHEKQAQFVLMMSNAADGVKEALDAMKKGSVSLNSIAASMHETMRLQAMITSSPGMAPAVDISGAMRGYSDAAEVMQNSGSVLKDSAVVLKQVSMQLRDTLDGIQTTQSQNGRN